MHPQIKKILAWFVFHVALVSSFSGSWNYALLRSSVRHMECCLSAERSNNDEAIEQRNLRFAGVGRLYTPPPSDDSTENDHLHIVGRLTQATVMVVGLGGVGSWAAEALCRSGVGNLVLIDLDDICISNTNRQLHAMSSTVGRFKIDEMERRFKDINPQCNVTLIHNFVSDDNVDAIFTSIPGLTACLDAIDGARGKSALIAACARYQIPLVTCGSSAGRTDPCSIVCEDLSRANGDPLLAACRKSLRKEYGFKAGLAFKNKEGKRNRPPQKWNITAVFSKELQRDLPKGSDTSSLRRCDGALGTAVFITGTCGFVAAEQIVTMIANANLIAPRSHEGNSARIASVN